MRRYVRGPAVSTGNLNVNGFHLTTKERDATTKLFEDDAGERLQDEWKVLNESDATNRLVPVQHKRVQLACRFAMKYSYI